MKIYKDPDSLARRIDKARKSNKVIGFVPTMGYLHEGHLSLIKMAKKDSGLLVVSIFVNKAQFGPKEDFKAYPRDLRRDMALCRQNKVDVVFAPDVEAMYPEEYSTYVNVEGLSEVFCGASRPGHFKGVATIVAKLFNIVKPDTAYFGQKDAQQVALVKKMVKDLNVPVKIKTGPIIREKDGLAMSSRNIYLDPDERASALCLYKSLRLALELFRKGERDSKKIIRKMRGLILKERYAKIDYIAMVDPGSFKEQSKVSKNTLVAMAVYIGKTRLIDNVILK